MSKPSNVLDLNAARRETAFPDGIDVPFGATTFKLPGEFPADVFDPFLSDEFDLTGIILAVFKDTEANKDKQTVERLVDVLFDRPKLPKETLDAIYASLELLFGEEQWADFKRERPSFLDLARLVSGLIRLYGVSLGEAFASVSSAANAGPTSKPTSLPATPDSTPEPSGDDPEPATDSSD